ncbi:unnamed protein product [Sphagnum balticum]
MPLDFMRDHSSSSMTDDASYPAAAASSLSKASGLCGGTKFIWPQDERPLVLHNDFQGAEELPILDLCNLHHQSDEHPSSCARDKIARDLVKILSDWGFVQLVNHGVDTQVIQEMQAQAKKFFDLPLEQKEKAKVSPASSSSSSSNNKNHEGFGYGVESGFYYDGKPWIDRFQCRWSPVESITELADKVYCEDAHEAEEFRLNSLSLSLSLSHKSVEEYYRSLDMLREQVLELCAEGLGLESSTFTKPYLGTAGECTARFNYYPPCPLPSLTLGLGAHTDPNLLTILHQCKVGGLQIYRNGSWLSVKPLTNSFILNIGDSFEAWTNGRFKSVRHRAVVNETEARLSIAYFSNPPPLSVMTVPQNLIDSLHPLQFRPSFTWVDYKLHLLEMHKKPKGFKTSKAWLRSTKSV